MEGYMLQIKIISYPDKENVEESFKKWASDTNCNIQDIKYSVVMEEYEIRHNVLILYTNNV